MVNLELFKKCIQHIKAQQAKDEVLSDVLVCEDSRGWVSTADELIEKAVKYKSYMNSSGGGITASGGEATLQPEFLAELFAKAKEQGIHTCLDTSGFVDIEKICNFA